MNTGLRLKRRFVGTAFLVLATCLLTTQAAAENLDAKAARSLISGRTWQMKLGSGYAFWSWKSDGSVLSPRR